MDKLYKNLYKQFNSSLYELNDCQVSTVHTWFNFLGMQVLIKYLEVLFYEKRIPTIPGAISSFNQNMDPFVTCVGNFV
jgi:hypothetical protein